MRGHLSSSQTKLLTRAEHRGGVHVCGGSLGGMDEGIIDCCLRLMTPH